MIPFQLHSFLSFRSIAYCPLSTRWRRFLRIQSMTPCALDLLVTFLHLVAPLLEILVDGIFSVLVKPRSLFTWLHRFLHLQSMATCNFDRIATSLQVAALLLAPSVHDLLHLQSACAPSSLGSTASYAFSRRRLQYASSTAEPLHCDSLPTALLLELSVNSLLSSLHSVAPILAHSVHNIFGLRSIFGISSLGGAAS
jgi:hypothetical protein